MVMWAEHHLTGLVSEVEEEEVSIAVCVETAMGLPACECGAEKAAVSPCTDLESDCSCRYL